MQEQMIYQRASFIRRFFARGLDILILTVAQVFGEWALFVDILYFYFSLLLFRKTIGDKVLNLELISSNNETRKIQWFQVLVRILLAPIGMFHGLLSPLGNNIQLIHDKMAKTDVIYKKR